MIQMKWQALIFTEIIKIDMQHSSSAAVMTGTLTRHVKINGSPVSLTENSAVFRKTDF